MALRTVQNAPAVAQDTLNLPGSTPTIPDDVTARFSSMGDWGNNLNEWWQQVQSSLQDTLDSVAGTTNVVYKNVGDVSASQGNLSARITTETSARIAGDAALASSIATVSSLASGKAKISVQSSAPSSPSINDLWLDTAVSPPTYQFWDGAAWDLQPDGTLAAAISTEATTRASADGFLSAKYTVTVVAGNVVTGFNITSSTGSGTNVSNVSFTAGSFNIWDGTTSYPIFATTTGAVALAGTLVVNTNGKVFIGSGTYNDAGTPFYVDSSGNLSLGTALLWNNSTHVLQVTGTIAGTAGYFGTSTNSVAITTTGLSVGNSGAISGGQTGYNTGAGFWLGFQSGAYGFSIGDGVSNRLLWNGTALLLQMTGTMVTTSTILNTDSTSFTTWQGDPGITIQGIYTQHTGATGGVNMLGVGSGIPSLYMSRAGGSYGARTGLSANSIVGRVNYAPYDGSSWSISVRADVGISASTATPYYAIEVGPTPFRTIFNYDGKMYLGQDSLSPNSSIYGAPYVSDPLANIYRAAAGVVATDAAFRASSIQMPDGSLGSPSYTFTNEPGLGIYRFGSGDMRMVIGGFPMFVIQASQSVFLNRLKLGDAFVAGAPAATGSMMIRDSTGTDYRVLCAP